MRAESNMIVQGERPQSHIVATQYAYMSVKRHILHTTTKPRRSDEKHWLLRTEEEITWQQSHSREAGLQDCRGSSAGQHWQILQFPVRSRYVCMQIASEHKHTHRVSCLRDASMWTCQQCRVYRKADGLLAFIPKALTPAGKCVIAVWRAKADTGGEILWTVTWLVYWRGTWRMYPMAVEGNQRAHFQRAKPKTAGPANGATSALFCILGLAPVFQTENHKNAALFSPLRRWPITFLSVCVNTKLSFSEWWNAALKQGRETSQICLKKTDPVLQTLSWGALRSELLFSVPKEMCLLNIGS